MRPAVKRRIASAFIIGLGLILLASGILVFAEATAFSDEAKRCAPSIWQSQWPRYLGCAMTTHEGLAGGLIGAAGALFAALLVIDAIQERTSSESDRQKLEQAEAKISAVVHITPVVHAFRKHGDQWLARAGQARGARDVTLERRNKQIRLAGKSSRFRSGRSTGMCLTAIGALNVFVNISERPSPILGRVDRLETQRDALMKLHTYLRAFDPDLARAFARNSKTSPPAVTLERG
jgi:hypothetical protein